MLVDFSYAIDVVFLKVWIAHDSCLCADTIVYWSLMHFRTMVHAKSDVQMMCIVMRLRWSSMIVITTVIIVILLSLLALRVFLVFHATILKPNFNLLTRFFMEIRRENWFLFKILSLIAFPIYFCINFLEEEKK